MSQPREENKKMIKKGHFANFLNVNISRFVFHLSFFLRAIYIHHAIFIPYMSIACIQNIHKRQTGTFEEWNDKKYFNRFCTFWIINEKLNTKNAPRESRGAFAWLLWIFINWRAGELIPTFVVSGVGSSYRR